MSIPVPLATKLFLRPPALGKIQYRGYPDAAVLVGDLAGAHLYREDRPILSQAPGLIRLHALGRNMPSDQLAVLRHDEIGCSHADGLIQLVPEHFEEAPVGIENPAVLRQNEPFYGLLRQTPETRLAPQSFFIGPPPNLSPALIARLATGNLLEHYYRAEHLAVLDYGGRSCNRPEEQSRPYDRRPLRTSCRTLRT